MRYICGQLEVLLSEGDVTEMDCDAIVNAANNHLWMGAGVAGAIKKKGGKVIEEEAVKKGPIPVGEAVVTTGGALRAEYVIHAAGMGQDLSTDTQKIYHCTLNSLKRARELGLKSIAFPAIGTGVGGFPPGRSRRFHADRRGRPRRCRSGFPPNSPFRSFPAEHLPGLPGSCG